MSLSIFFEDKTLMNEVLSRCNISNYNMCNAVYKDNANRLKQGIHININNMNSTDELLSLLRMPDYVTVAIGRDINSYASIKTNIWLANNQTPIDTNMMILTKGI
jgi:hypothetical protein